MFFFNGGYCNGMNGFANNLCDKEEINTAAALV